MPGKNGPSWKTRLKAWWQGYDVPASGQTESNHLSMRDRQAEQFEINPGKSEHWTPIRVEIAETIWGQGFSTPGGDEFVSTLFKPFGLNEEMSVLDLGAGLGGAARAMARETGAWVTGYESDEVLQRAAMARSIKAGMEKRAPVVLFEWDDLKLEKRFEAIFSKEAFFAVRWKEALFETLRQAMKPKGQMVFTDYALKHSAKTAGAVSVWRDTEPEKPYPQTVGQTVEQLQANGFDVRTSEDITETYCAQVLGAWETLTTTLPQTAKTDQFKGMVIDEGEKWMRRLAALNSGDLRVYRYYAMLPG